MKGFNTVVPNRKNIGTEEAIMAMPSSVARSSPALDGSFGCTFSGSPSFLLEAASAGLWGKSRRILCELLRELRRLPCGQPESGSLKS